MPRELFGDVSNPKVEIGSRSRYTLPVSIALHMLIVGIVLLVPVMAPSLVPTPPSLLIFAAPAPPPPLPLPPPAPNPQPVRVSSVSERSDAAAPTDAPSTIADERPAAPHVPKGVGVADGVEGGLGLPGATVTSLVNIPDPPPPPRPPEPVRPGGDIKEPRKTRHVPPVYPRLAQQTGVDGVVMLEAVIDVDGRVRDVRVLRSVPLLDPAAIDAVLQWRFTPTLLNGIPVPVVMTVTVHFTLRDES